jgi:hypothetical protein
VDKDVVDQIDGEDHHKQGGDDRCAEDDAHDQDFRFGGLFDLLDQIVDVVDESGILSSTAPLRPSRRMRPAGSIRPGLICVRQLLSTCR